MSENLNVRQPASIQFPVGTKLKIVLNGHACAGYLWDTESVNKSGIVSIVRIGVQKPAEGEPILFGQSYPEIYVVTALHPGIVELRERRPFENNQGEEISKLVFHVK